MTPNRRHRSPSPNTSAPRPLIDLSPLLRPALYNQIPTAGIPPPFLHSANQLPPDTPLSTLLSAGHFRAAAEKAADTLSSGLDISPLDIPRILSLFHTRLATLVLLSHAELAAKEARAFLDILAREAGSASQPSSRATSRERRSPIGAPIGAARGAGERTNPLALIPWDLRLLLERLKTVLVNDKRRGIMGLYQLGSECRVQAAAAAKTGDDDSRAVWSARLLDLGIRVAAELVDMGEFETALRHLETLERGIEAADLEARTRMAVRRALLYLKMGNLEAAEKCFEGSDVAATEVLVLRALGLMAEGDYDAAAAALEPLRRTHPDDELVRQNLAVCLLYAGDITAASEMLEGLVDGTEESGGTGKTFTGLLFNLATIYELRTERARDRKVVLVERLAERDAADGAGYERRGVEFKL